MLISVPIIGPPARGRGRRRSRGRSWPRSRDRGSSMPGRAQAEQGEAHRHAVVVVGRDPRRRGRARAGRRPAVGLLVDGRCRSSRSSRDHGARCGRSPCGGCGRRRGSGSARRRTGPPPPASCTVSLIAFMSTSTPRSGPAPSTVVRVRARGDGAAHVLQDVDERQVALDAVRAQPLDGDRPAGDGGGGEEVARGRGVGLDRVVAGRGSRPARTSNRRSSSRCRPGRRTPPSPPGSSPT